MKILFLVLGIVLFTFVKPVQSQPDLILSEQVLINSFRTDVILNNDQCFISEGCLSGLGSRQIIRFTTQISNIGNQDFYVGKPPATLDEPSELWEFDYCHAHWHYEGYAEYNLLDSDGNPTPVGFKNGFCLADITCDDGYTAKYDCNNQGISAHCTDIYASNLDCQWIDVTDIPDGTYKFEMKVNAYEHADYFGRQESNYNNNTIEVCFNLTRNTNGEHFAHILGNGTACGGSSAEPCSSVTINVLFDQYPQETHWEIRGSEDYALFSGGPYSATYAGSLLSEVICLPYDCYNFTIFDSGEDGICCEFGNGFFQIVNASGQLLLNGGSFESNDINSFCIGEDVSCTDIDNDGICSDLDCDDGNAAVPAPAGAACDDNDPLTNHDEIGPDGCTCIGLVIDENCPHQLQLGLQFDRFPYETAWEVQDAAGNTIAEHDFYYDTSQRIFIIETLCVPNGCYSLIMIDSFGDGMCCDFDGGYYTLTDAQGNILAQGDNYENEEITNFCISGCEEFLYVTDTLKNIKVHYKANQTIIGNSPVLGNSSDVIFDADRVTLNNGFKATTNSSFKVRNSGCSD